MNNEDEVIEILDDFEDIITINPINENLGGQSNVQSDVSVDSEMVSTIPQNNFSNNLGVSSIEETKVEPQLYNEVKNLADVNYSPIELEREETNIETNVSDENTKSGLGFVIVLFVLLAVFVIALPYISKLF